MPAVRGPSTGSARVNNGMRLWRLISCRSGTRPCLRTHNASTEIQPDHQSDGRRRSVGVERRHSPNGATDIWAKSLSRVVGKDGITVNSIPPGRLHSEQIDQNCCQAQRKWVAENCPAGYIGEPEDLAVLVAFLASPLARYITGQVVHVDGGARRFSR
ncbi:SDR family NAD(P)-dependent oxidoreductase [Bradyrhizobium sp. LB13.1]|jgi:Enoyl-(Acyl carrier protein) reductase